MLLLPKNIHSSCIRFFAVALSLTFLESFGRNKCALAQFLGPDTRYAPRNPFADYSDYPQDDELRSKYRYLRPGRTVLTVFDVNWIHLYRYYCEEPDNHVLCVYEAWPRGFLNRKQSNGVERSERWARDFYARYMAIYMAVATGIVDILTNPGDLEPGSHDCAWYFEILRLLKLNEKVTAIFAVNIIIWSDRRLIWTRGEDEETGESSRGGGDGETGNNGGGAFSIVPIGVGTSIGTTPAAALSGILGAIKSKISPAIPFFPGDGPDKDSEVKPLEFPLKTDIYPLPMASLPSSDDTNGEVGKAPEPQTDEKSPTSNPLGTDPAFGGTSNIDKTTDLTFNTGDNFQTEIAGNENPDSKALFRRRRRALLPRDSKDEDCMNPLLIETDVSDDFHQPIGAPSDPNPDSYVDPNPVPSMQPGTNVEKLFVQEDVATIYITQHDKVSPEGNYKLDIRILDAQGKEIQNQQGVDRHAGTEIKVPVTDWRPLYLTVDEDREKPIQIKYGDIFLLGPQTDWGLTFDSNDQRHDCVVSPWKDSKRNIQCHFIMAHSGS